MDDSAKAVPLRRCDKCGSENAEAVDVLEEGLSRYLHYECPNCGHRFKVPPAGTTGYWITMTWLACGSLAGLFLIYDRYDYVAGLAAVAAVATVIQLLPFLRHPANRSEPSAEALSIADRLGQTDLMTPLAAGLRLVVFILLLLGMATAAGLANHYWLDWW